jgi:hypothetical protein
MGHCLLLEVCIIVVDLIVAGKPQVGYNESARPDGSTIDRSPFRGEHCDFSPKITQPYLPSNMVSWKSTITNKCLSLAFRPMRNTSVQSELEKIRDQKEKWAEDYAPPARVLDDKTTTHTLEHLGRRKEDGGKIGDCWPVYHFRSQSSGNGTDGLAHKPVVVYFHSGGFYGQVSYEPSLPAVVAPAVCWI